MAAFESLEDPVPVGCEWDGEARLPGFFFFFFFLKVSPHSCVGDKRSQAEDSISPVNYWTTQRKGQDLLNLTAPVLGDIEMNISAEYLE